MPNDRSPANQPKFPTNSKGILTAILFTKSYLFETPMSAPTVRAKKFPIFISRFSGRIARGTRISNPHVIVSPPHSPSRRLLRRVSSAARGEMPRKSTATSISRSVDRQKQFGSFEQFKKHCTLLDTRYHTLAMSSSMPAVRDIRRYDQYKKSTATMMSVHGGR